MTCVSFEEEIILASISPRRRKLFSSLGLPHVCISPDFEEIEDHICPEIVSLINAEGKSKKISERYPDKWVISADTVIEFKSEIIGKPNSLAEAENMLQRFSGESQIVITSVCICRKLCNSVCLFSETSEVRFKTLTSNEIREYLNKINPLDKAGGYAIDEYSSMIIQDIKGSRTNVSGLPMEKLIKSLYALGIGNSIMNRMPSSG